jgi:hypothetical protein
LAEKFGVPVVTLSSVTIQVKLPRDQVNLLVPKKRTVLSEEEKARRRALLSKVRVSRQSSAQEATKDLAE